jgi:probable rRNA maturation factor
MPVDLGPQRRRAQAVPAAAPRAILIANRYPRLRFKRAEVARVIHVLDAQPDALGLSPARIPSGELSLVFLNDQALAELHADFLDDPTTTDVITFEGESGPGIPPEACTAGEICVSVDTAAKYAREHRHDFGTELTLYLVHGWLHLAGFDDLVPAKKRVMRRAEARALKLLQQADAMPKFVLK